MPGVKVTAHLSVMNPLSEWLRYELFCKYFPELAHRLPEKDVWAFLSISRSTLRESKTDLLLKRMRRRDIKKRRG